MGIGNPKVFKDCVTKNLKTESLPFSIAIEKCAWVLSSLNSFKKAMFFRQGRRGNRTKQA
jgi:hypothetical protein